MRALLTSSCVLRAVSRTLLIALCTAALGATATASQFTLRSGNAPVGQPDPFIRYVVEPSGLCGAAFPAVFGPADFAAAAAGPNPTVVNGYFVWLPSLACDPLAKWIALDSSWSPRSTLFAYEFVVPEPCCFQQATLDLCWAVDDALGDYDTLTNPGVFLNGTPLAISGGSYATETQATADVTSILHCGTNTLYVYNRDGGCAVSGVIFSATFTLQDCTVSVEPSAWGRVKALYR